MRKIRIGTRSSRLALVQVKEAADLLGLQEVEIKTFDTSGDIDKITPIDEVEGSDFFTDTIETALLEGEIDLAVHAAKDLPDTIPEGLKIVAITESIDPVDVLVSRGNLKLTELSFGAKVGTSSQRRKEQLTAVRPDLQVIDLRGNVDERLEKFDRGQCDAIVIAAAGLIRLGLEKRITERLSFETVKGQGALALEVRENDTELEKWLRVRFI